MRMRKTTRRTRIVSVAVFALAAALAFGQDKPRAGEPYALIAGTVFRDPGFALPGAKVVLSLESRPDKKLQEQISSPTGEFAFRVKPDANRYLVRATFKGFLPASKSVEITGQEQARATLVLVPESNSKGR